MSGEHVQSVLDRLADGKRVLSAFLVTRDGLPVRSASRRSVSDASLGAMTAAMMGAGQVALEEFGAGAVQTAHVLAGSSHLYVRVVGDDYLLALVVTTEMPAGELAKAHDEVAKAVAA